MINYVVDPELTQRLPDQRAVRDTQTSWVKGRHIRCSYSMRITTDCYYPAARDECTTFRYDTRNDPILYS
jgi:hypothetical protein